VSKKFFLFSQQNKSENWGKLLKKNTQEEGHVEKMRIGAFSGSF